jgi:hypothetical protein
MAKTSGALAVINHIDVRPPRRRPRTTWRRAAGARRLREATPSPGRKRGSAGPCIRQSPAKGRCLEFLHFLVGQASARTTRGEPSQGSETFSAAKVGQDGILRRVVYPPAWALSETWRAGLPSRRRM